MAASLVIVINETNNTIQHIKDKVYNATNGMETTEKLISYLTGVMSGAISANVQVTIRDTDPVVSTSGAGSVQQTHTHK